MKTVLLFLIGITISISIFSQEEDNENNTAQQPVGTPTQPTNTFTNDTIIYNEISSLAEQINEVKSNLLDNSLKFYSILISVIVGIVSILIPIMMYLQNKRGNEILKETSNELKLQNNNSLVSVEKEYKLKHEQLEKKINIKDELEAIKTKLERTVNEKVAERVKDLMDNQYEAFIFDTTISYTQEVLAQSNIYKQVLLARNRSLIQSISKNLKNGNFVKTEQELQNYNEDWYVLSRVFSGDEKQLINALNDYINKRAFNELVPALENLQKRKANNPTVYNLISKALNAGYELL